MDVNKSNNSAETASEFSDDLRFSFRSDKESSNRILIEPIGSINFLNAVYFEKRINTLIDEGYIHLFFDMNNTKYVAAVGIGSFIHLSARVKKMGGAIVLERMKADVLVVFQLPGFVDYFIINDGISSDDLNGNWGTAE